MSPAVFSVKVDASTILLSDFAYLRACGIIAEGVKLPYGKHMFQCSSANLD